MRMNFRSPLLVRRTRPEGDGQISEHNCLCRHHLSMCLGFSHRLKQYNTAGSSFSKQGMP